MLSKIVFILILLSICYAKEAKLIKTIWGDVTGDKYEIRRITGLPHPNINHNRTFTFPRVNFK